MNIFQPKLIPNTIFSSHIPKLVTSIILIFYIILSERKIYCLKEVSDLNKTKKMHMETIKHSITQTWDFEINRMQVINKVNLTTYVIII